VKISIARIAAKLRGAVGKEHSNHSALLLELEGLKAEQLDAVARALALLWDDFIETSGGPDVFRSPSEEERGGYVAICRESVEAPLCARRERHGILRRIISPSGPEQQRTAIMSARRVYD
jgi:hypothetical protein